MGTAKLRRWGVAAVIAMGTAVVTMLCASAGGQAATFRWTNTGDAVSMDPYSINEGFTLGFTGNMYDGLILRGPDLKIGPGLATSWKRTDPNTWEFQLRQGVKFHDGTDFTAEDVVFSWQRAMSGGSDLKGYFLTVKSVEAKDPHTVIIRTTQPNPILLADLSVWWIMSKAWCEKNDAVGVSDIRKNIENYATRHANGTGPFVLVSREADVKTELKRNPHWWGWAAGVGKSNVDDVVFTPIKQDGTRIAALLSGSVDMVYEVPMQDIDRVKAAGDKVFQVPEIRTIFLGMDQSRPELLESDVKGKNPFKDRRVRLALYKAIDEDLIVRQIMKGAAVSANTFVVKEAAGYDPAFKRLGYDPVEAKKLLGEAGYPDGFEVGFDCPNDRYVNDALICQALVSMWAKIGVRAKLLAQTKSLYFNKILKRDTSLYMLGWAPATVDGQNVLDNLLVTPGDNVGRFNLGSYSNPALDALANQARSELDVEKRTALIKKAMDLAHQDVGSIPLHYQQIIWAGGPNVTLLQRADNLFYWPWVNLE